MMTIGLPMALGGEAVSSGTAIAVLSGVSIVGGYLLLFGLWYFIFREKKPARSGALRHDDGTAHESALLGVPSNGWGTQDGEPADPVE